MTELPAQPQRRVIVVEDDPVMREHFALVLTKLGFAVEVAADGMSALQLMRNSTYALALCDIRMPRLDGISLLRNLRQALPPVNVPVIFATAASDPALRRQAESAGAAAVLVKPVSSEVLTAAVHAAMDDQRSARTS